MALGRDLILKADLEVKTNFSVHPTSKLSASTRVLRNPQLVKKCPRISTNLEIHHRNNKAATGPYCETDHVHPSTSSTFIPTLNLGLGLTDALIPSELHFSPMHATRRTNLILLYLWLDIKQFSPASCYFPILGILPSNVVCSCTIVIDEVSHPQNSANKITICILNLHCNR